MVSAAWSVLRAWGVSLGVSSCRSATRDLIGHPEPRCGADQVYLKINFRRLSDSVARESGDPAAPVLRQGAATRNVGPQLAQAVPLDMRGKDQTQSR
jgi:hypothetical protein